MKNIVRAFVAALVLTGTVAAAHTATKGNVSYSSVNVGPRPQCDPGVPDGCGL